MNLSDGLPVFSSRGDCSKPATTQTATRAGQQNAVSKSRRIMLALLISASGLTGCSLFPQRPTTVATATEMALCAEWGRSLPTRSRSDTEQTQREIARSYDVFTAACGREVP